MDDDFRWLSTNEAALRNVAAFSDVSISYPRLAAIIRLDGTGEQLAGNAQLETMSGLLHVHGLKGRHPDLLAWDRPDGHTSHWTTRRHGMSWLDPNLFKPYGSAQPTVRRLAEHTSGRGLGSSAAAALNKPASKRKKPGQAARLESAPVAAAWWGRPGYQLAGTSMHAFMSHASIRIPIASVDDHATRRAAINRLLTASEGCKARRCPCILPSLHVKCPRSFGNNIHRLLSDLMLSFVEGARLNLVSPLDCNGLLRPKIKGGYCSHCHQNLSSTSGAGRITHPVELMGNGSAGFASTLLARERLSWPKEACSSVDSSYNDFPRISFHAQEMTILKFTRSRAARVLFGLGAHVAFGAVFDATFDIVDPTGGVNYRFGDDELRIGVHVRHMRPWYNGNESVDVFAEAIHEAVVGDRAAHSSSLTKRRCAILLATDRRLALRTYEIVAAREGCRLVIAPRGEEQSSYNREHGADTGVVVLRDLHLLAQAHVLIGTWGSTLTLTAQELMAARFDGGPILPTVRYCHYWVTGRAQPRRCLAAWPLVTTPENSWYVTLERGAIDPSDRPYNSPHPIVHWPLQQRSA